MLREDADYIYLANDTDLRLALGNTVMCQVEVIS
jgi:hypothetical protein